MFAVIGEALLDMVQSEPGSAFYARPGGGPLNIAAGLRRLGHPTEMMARLSTGRLGALVRQHLTAHELGVSYCVETAAPTTLAFATLDGAGQASYEFYVEGTADWGWTPEDLGELPPGTEAVHTGSLAAALDPGAGVLLDQWRRWRGEGEVLLSFDPNVRPALLTDRAEACRRVEEFVAASHVVKASDEDTAWLYPGTDPHEVAERWCRAGAEVAIVTRGPAGCLSATRDGLTVERRGRAVDVIDTIGAGDSFCSGLLSGLADGGHLAPSGVQRLSRDSLSAVLDRAVLTSALTCQRRGSDPPSRADYESAAAVMR